MTDGVLLTYVRTRDRLMEIVAPDKARNRDATKCPSAVRFPLERHSAAQKFSVIQCQQAPEHDGYHFAAWGGSQKWRQSEWDDNGKPRPALKQPSTMEDSQGDQPDDDPSRTAGLPA